MSNEATAGEARTDREAPTTEKDGGNKATEEHADGIESFRPVPADVGPLRTNGGHERRMPELPAFQRDILLTLARSGATNGQGLKDDLGCLRDEDVNDGRLYPNLNDLVDDGLVIKREWAHDDRSHEFELSPAGRASVRKHRERVSEAAQAINGGDR